MRKIIHVIIIIVFMIAFSQNLSYCQIQNQTISLKTGFNFISFYIKPSLSSQQLKNKFYFIEDVYSYSPSAGSFISLNEGLINAFTPGKGYIFKSSSQSDFIIEGELAPVNTNTSIKTGFNLCGFLNPLNDYKFSNLMTKYSNIKGVYKWSSSSGAFIQVLRNNNEIELLDGIDPSISRGQAYFINSNNDFTIDSLTNSIDTPPTQIQIKTVGTSANKFIYGSGNIIEMSEDSTRQTSEVKIDEKIIDQYTTEYNMVSNAFLGKMTIYLPISNNLSVDDVALLCIDPESGKSAVIRGSSQNNFLVFSLDNKNKNAMPSNSGSLDLPEPDVDSKTLYKLKGELIKKHKGEVDDAITKLKSTTQSPPFKWPFYRQYGGNCWAATWMMLLKGYKDDLLTTEHDSIHRILSKYKIGTNQGANFYTQIANIHGVKSNYAFVPKIDEISSKILEISIGADYRIIEKDMAAYMINRLNNGIPLYVSTGMHALLVTGYKLTDSKITINEENIVSNVKFYGHNPQEFFPQDLLGTELGNVDEMIKKWGIGSREEIDKDGKTIQIPGINNMTMFIFYSAKSYSTPNEHYTTIQLPDKANADNNDRDESGVLFYNKTSPLCHSGWNNSNSVGYSWYASGWLYDAIYEMKEFDDIKFKNIDVFDSSASESKLKVKIDIFRGDKGTVPENIIFSKDDSLASMIVKLEKKEFGSTTSYRLDAKKYAEYNNTMAMVTSFKNKLSNTLGIIDNFYIRIALVGNTAVMPSNVEADPLMQYDFFEPYIKESNNKIFLKFKYRKLFIKPSEPIDSIYKPGSKINFTANAGTDIIPVNNIIWSCDRTDLASFISPGELSIKGLIAAPNQASSVMRATIPNSKIIVKATVYAPASVHHEKEAEYEITVGSSTTPTPDTNGFHIEIDPPVSTPTGTTPTIEWGRQRLVAKIAASDWPVSGWDVKCLAHNQYHNYEQARYGDLSHIMIMSSMRDDASCKGGEYCITAYIDAKGTEPYKEAKINVKIADFNPGNGPVFTGNNTNLEVRVYPTQTTIYTGEKLKLSALIAGTNSSVTNIRWYLAPNDIGGKIEWNGTTCTFTAPDNDLGYGHTVYFKAAIDGKEYSASSSISVGTLRLELTGPSSLGNGETVKFQASLSDIYSGSINVPITWTNSIPECGSIVPESNGNIKMTGSYSQYYGVGRYVALKNLKSYPAQDVITATAVYQGRKITKTVNITVNEIKILFPNQVIVLQKGYSSNLNNYASVAGAQNTNMNFMNDTKEVGDGTNFQTPDYIEPYYDDYGKSNLTVKSGANKEVSEVIQLIIARPVLKEIKEYYDSGRIFQHYKAVVNIDLEYYSNHGTIKEDVAYKHGFYKKYNTNGGLVEDCIFINDKLDGLYQRYYDNGSLELKCFYNNNVLHGLYEKYGNDSKGYGEIGEYYNNIAENTWTFTSRSGRKEWEGKYIHAKKEGKWTSWYDNDNNRVQSVCEYVNNKRNGACSEWYDDANNQMSSQGQYVNDVKSGTWKQWWYPAEAGKPMTETTITY